MAVKKGVKKKEHENLSDANIEKVIGLLSAEKPITKKEACEILNISYNTTRLNKIIEEYTEAQENDRKRRAANRGRPAQEHEISTVVESYLSGDSVKAIADQLYRSTSFVKQVIETVGVPDATITPDYFNPEMLPEPCVKDSFAIEEYVWSAKYGAIAKIVKEYPYLSKEGSKLYRISVFERIEEEKALIDGRRYDYFPTNMRFGGFYANQPAHELGSLEHLRKVGASIERAIK